MAFVDGQFPGVESFLILCLLLPIAEDHYGLDVPVSSRIVQEGVLAGVHFLESTPVLYQLNEAIVVVIPDCDHGRSFFELVLRSVRQYFFFEDEVHDFDVACSCQEMEEVSFVPGEGPKIDVGVVYE